MCRAAAIRFREPDHIAVLPRVGDAVFQRRETAHRRCFGAVRSRHVPQPRSIFAPEFPVAAFFF